MSHRGFLTVMAGLVGAALLGPGASLVEAQQQFQFVVSALNADGSPVMDLTVKDVLMSENGVANEILDVQPFRVPVKLTLAVDNGLLSADAVVHYRSGLAALVQALPPDVEVELITTAPQPRRVVRATTDREEIERGITRFAPEKQTPRFTDSLVEFSKRFQDEFEDAKRMDSIPVMVAISTTANEATSYQPPEVAKALTFLRARRARLYVVVLSVRQDLENVGLNDNRQALIGIPAVQSTGGRYEALAISNRLTTLLPEFGEEIAGLHTKYNNQWVVTVRRREGITGTLQNPRVELTRPDLIGEVSLDGMPAPPEVAQ